MNHYRGDLADLSYAENDAEEVAKELHKAGFAVTLLTTRRGKRDPAAMPTAAAIRRALLEAVKGRRKADIVLIAMAGHGVQLEVADPEGKEASKTYPYFCPTDFDRAGIRFETGLGPRQINLNWLFGQLEGCSAGWKVVLVDACRNLGKAAAKRYIDAKKVTVPDGVCALFSCAPGQVAYEADGLGGRGHGVFFHFVLQGLRGEAKNAEGEVTWSSLTNYVARGVAREVPRLAGPGHRQTPHQVTNVIGETPVLVAAGGTGPERPKGDGGDVTNSTGMKLVRVPAGEFLMGSPAGENDRDEDEAQHKVRITKAFHLGVHEVTQRQFKAVMGYDRSFFSKAGGGAESVAGIDTDDFPVERVSWGEATRFCEKLTALPGEARMSRVYRLPTEAEWEYACRAAGDPSRPFHFGHTLDDASKQANFDGSRPYGSDRVGERRDRTCQVGSYPANRFGLYDMHGNVWEWCSDWYEARRPLGTPADPAGPSAGAFRVVRGGSWYNDGRYCRSGERESGVPSSRLNRIGFRVVLVGPR